MLPPGLDLDPDHFIQLDGYWTDDRSDYAYACSRLFMAQLMRAFR